MEMPKLTPEDKAKWIATLRSGDFKQAIGALRKTITYDSEGNPVTGYCCLGVFCEIKGILPTGPYDAGGLYTKLYGEIGNNNCHRLIGLNDSRTSFPAIADWIEENVNG